MEEKIVCPKCKHTKFNKAECGYDGCCTDEGRYGRDMGCGIDHEAYHCLNCGCVFTIWEKDMVRKIITKKQEKELKEILERNRKQWKRIMKDSNILHRRGVLKIKKEAGYENRSH